LGFPRNQSKTTVLVNRYGYRNMLMRPNRVMPLMAMPISSSLAPIAGATAAMADAPQIDVPTPMSMASLFEIPSLFPSVRLVMKANSTMTMALTAPIPTSSQTLALVTSPSNAIDIFSRLDDE